MKKEVPMKAKGRRIIPAVTAALCLMAAPLQGTGNAHYMRQLEEVARAEGLTVRNPVQAPDGYVWMVSEKGTARFDGYRIACPDCPEPLRTEIHEADTLVLCPDEESHLLWIHSEKGILGALDRLTYTFTATPGQAREGYRGFHHGKVYHWLYDSDKGCCRIRYTNGAFEVETYPHTIRQIGTDENGNDWILTGEGLFRNGFDQGLPGSEGIGCIALYRGLCLGITPEKLLIYNRSRQMVRSTPLPFRHQGTNTRLLVQGENLWIYTEAATYCYQMVDGIFMNQPSANLPETDADSLSTGATYLTGHMGTTVTQLTVDGQVLITPYEWGKIHTLPDSIEIGVTSFTFLPKGEWFYQFFLEGVDKDWSSPTPTATAVYKGLPAGNYRLHVRSASDDCQWGPESVCTFSIAPPWWHNPAGWVAGFILLAGTGIWLRHRHKNRRKTLPEGEEGTTGTEKGKAGTAEKGIRPRIVAPWHNLEEERSGGLPEEEKKKPSSLRDERFRLMLEESISQHITDPDFMVDHLATLMQMGRTRFYSRTKEVMGCSPAELLRYRRLEHAAELLRKTDLTIDKVREICCFSNSTNFYTAFKQRFGTTPRQYRQAGEKEV